MIIHTVQPGECLQEIANRYRIPLNRLIEDNGIRSLNHLVPGETLVILYPETVHTVLPGETVSSIARLLTRFTAIIRDCWKHFLSIRASSSSLR